LGLTPTYRVVGLLEVELLALLDVLLEHQGILHAVDDLEEELLLQQEVLVGDLDLVGLVVA